MPLNMLLGVQSAAGGGGATPPNTILGADLLAWHKKGTGIYDSVVGGSLVTTNNQEIGRWEDSSGNGYHATRHSAIGVGHLQWSTTTTDRGSGTINCTGDSNAYLDLPSGLATALSTAGQGEIAARLKATSTTAAGQLWVFGSVTSELYAWSDGHIYEGWGRNTRPDIGVPPVDIASAFRVYDCYSATNDWSAYLDENQFGNTLTNTVAWISPAPVYGPWWGWMSEIVICKRKMSSTERHDIYTYLST